MGMQLGPSCRIAQPTLAGQRGLPVRSAKCDGGAKPRTVGLLEARVRELCREGT